MGNQLPKYIMFTQRANGHFYISVNPNNMKVFALSVALACALAYASAASVSCGPDDVLLPNPEDCSSYFICDNGVPIESPCPPGLHFNAETLGCDFPQNSNCQVGSSTAKPTTTTTTTSKPTTTSTTTSKPTTNSTTTTPRPTTTSTTTTTTPRPTTTSTTTTTTTPRPTTTSTTTTRRPTTTSTTTTRRPTTTTTTTTRRPTTTSTTPEPTRPTTTSATEEPTTPPTEATNSTSTTAPPTTSPPSNVTSTTPQDPTITTPPPLNTTSTTPNPPATTTPTGPPSNSTTPSDPTITTPAPQEPTTETPSLCPTNGSVIISNTADCSSFIVCVNGAPSDPVPCPNDLLFSDKLGACDKAENVDCSYTTTTTTTTEATTTEEETTVTEVPTTEEPGFEPECPEEGFAIIENPGSCNTFYVCVNGAHGLIKCPSGLDFNPATLTCDLPENPNCGQNSTPPPFEPECPANTTVQVSDPNNCSSFYICINGNYAKLSCPDNYAFNETQQACVASSESTCVAVELKRRAMYTCEEDGTFPDPTDCGSYYVCAGNQIFPMQCPDGLYFDPYQGVCNIPSAVDCDANSPSTSSSTSTSTSTTTTTTSKPTSTSTTTTTTSKPNTSSTTTSTTAKPNGPNCPAQGSAILPDPEDCTRFYVCIEGNSDVIDCPEGYGFSEEALTCVKAEEVGCNVQTGPQCPAEGTAKFANPEDCNSYYFCINGVSALLRCPEGMNFDEQNGVCSATAECLEFTTTPPNTPSTSSTSKPTTSSTTKPTSSTSTTAKPSSSTSTTSKPTTPGEPGTCDFEDEGELRPNPASCTSFLQCAGGILVSIDCPPGLEFNGVALVCDLPQLANCSTKKSPFYFLGF